MSVMRGPIRPDAIGVGRVERVATEAVASAVAELRAHFGDRVSTGESIRDQHGRTLSQVPFLPPDAVVFAESSEEVRTVLAVAARFGVPLIPYGAGSSLQGQISATRGGLTLDLSRMNRILAVHPEDMDVVVEPGVTRKQLNQHIRDSGLFFPIDPGADASIGGMASTRASGTNAVRYGTMRENVLALEVVTPSGEVVRTGNRAKKSATGYDLTRLFVGSEGTLGVLTEVTLRVHPIPEAISVAVVAFETLKGAIDTAIGSVQLGVPIARVELLDDISIKATNVYAKLGLTELPTLFLEFHGSPAGVAEQAETVQAVAAENGGRGFEWTVKQEDRERLWRARHESGFTTGAYWPGRVSMPTDVCVPLSALTENILATRADIDASTIPGKIVGHVGDGNFHAGFAVRPGEPADIAEAQRLYDRVVERALASGGTASGEHGVGLTKLRYMEREHGPALDLMRMIKANLDPQGIMNPGKLIPR